jgi:hypothetical protein
MARATAIEKLFFEKTEVKWLKKNFSENLIVS